MDMAFDARPLSVVFHETSGRLEIAWSDGLGAALGSELLRMSCKCAECEQQRRAGRALPVPGGVRLLAIEPFGESALHLSFTDGHDRGIYPWSYLHGLGKAHPTASTQ